MPTGNPLGFNKYLYTDADFENGTDPTGHFDSVDIGVTMGIQQQMAAGFLGGALFNSLRNVALGRDPCEGTLQAGVTGALLLPILLANPYTMFAGVMLGLSAVEDSIEVATQTFNNPSSTPDQRVASSLYVVASLFGLAIAGDAYAGATGGQLIPPVPDDAYIMGIVPRVGMAPGRDGPVREPGYDLGPGGEVILDNYGARRGNRTSGQQRGSKWGRQGRYLPA